MAVDLRIIPSIRQTNSSDVLKLTLISNSLDLWSFQGSNPASLLSPEMIAWHSDKRPYDCLPEDNLRFCVGILWHLPMIQRNLSCIFLPFQVMYYIFIRMSTEYLFLLQHKTKEM
jgi:hypothetical protein